MSVYRCAIIDLREDCQETHFCLIEITVQLVP